MASHWDITDGMLQRMLTAFKTDIAGDSEWVMHLYKNDYTPIPGSDESDYVEADFPGYLAVEFLPSTFGSVTVASHVASMQATPALEFEADAVGFVDQTVYGYYITDGDDDYVYGERFSVEKVIHPEDILKVTPILRQATYPNP